MVKNAPLVHTRLIRVHIKHPPLQGLLRVDGRNDQNQLLNHALFEPCGQLLKHILQVIIKTFVFGDHHTELVLFHGLKELRVVDPALVQDAVDAVACVGKFKI